METTIIITFLHRKQLTLGILKDLSKISQPWSGKAKLWVQACLTPKLKPSQLCLLYRLWVHWNQGLSFSSFGSLPELKQCQLHRGLKNCCLFIRSHLKAWMKTTSLQEARMPDENFGNLFVGIQGGYVPFSQMDSWFYCLFCWGHLHSCS